MSIPAPRWRSTCSQKHLGRTFDVTFEAEAGGATAGRTADGGTHEHPDRGRLPVGAVPEVQMSPFFLNGISRSPLAAVTRYGDAIIIPRVFDDFRVKDLRRALAVARGGGVTVGGERRERQGAESHPHPRIPMAHPVFWSSGENEVRGCSAELCHRARPLCSRSY